jgi:hypothetical protein
MSRGATRAISSALSVDANAFAYDEVYDSLKAGEAAREAQRRAEAAQRAPKYIDSFLASAETRRLDRLRAEEEEKKREGELTFSVDFQLWREGEGQEVGKPLAQN